MGPSKSDNINKSSKAKSVNKNVNVSTICNNASVASAADDQQAPPLPEKLPLPLDTNVITIDGHTITKDGGISWSQQVPEKIKTILWNIRNNSTAVYDTTSPKTMKNIALGVAIILFLGVLTIVLAHKEEPTPINRYGMAFTLDDAIKSAAALKAAQLAAAAASDAPSSKRTLYGIPGESASSAASSLLNAQSASEVETPTTTPASDAKSNNDNNNVDVTTTTTSTMDPLDSLDRDSPAEGIIIGTSGGSNNNQDSDDDPKVEDDQRIVFIERLMGLHLNPNNNNNNGQGNNDNQQEGSMSSSDNDDSDVPKGIKWASRTRKFTFPIGSNGIGAASITASTANGDNSPDGPIPHPMLRYAAAAMMSRLIAAAARAQMEAQAREAIMSRISPKDKDDNEADEEGSVPVLLASLKDERSSVGPFGRPSPPMYGRPMPRSRGGPRPSMMSPRVMVPPPMASQGHPLLQQLQALQALSRLQMRQREGRQQMMSNSLPFDEIEVSRGSGPSGRGQPALVMVAIPIGAESSERRPMALPMTMSSPYASSPYGQSLPSPVVSQYPRSYSPYHPRQHMPVTYAAIQPSAASAMYQHVVPVAASHPHASYYRPMPVPPPSPSVAHYQRLMTVAGQGHHPTYQMRQIIEVPVEVPVPVHVPVPVAYPVPSAGHQIMSRMDSIPHPMMMSMAAPQHHPMMMTMAGHPGHNHAHHIAASRMMAASQAAAASADEENQEGHQDQIVLFYDAELHDKDGEDGSANNGNSNNDDLQSSASEHRSLDRNEQQQTRQLFPMRSSHGHQQQQQQQHPLFMIPSRSAERVLGMERSFDRVTGQERMSGQSPTPANLNRLRLLREIAKRSEAMNSASSASSSSSASSAPQSRTTSVYQAEDDAEVIQGRPSESGGPNGQQPAFIVLTADENGNINSNQGLGPVERRRR